MEVVIFSHDQNGNVFLALIPKFHLNFELFELKKPITEGLIPTAQNPN